MRHFWWFNTVILVTSIFFKAKKKGRITLNLMVHTIVVLVQKIWAFTSVFLKGKENGRLSAQTFFMSGSVHRSVLKFNEIQPLCR